MIKNGTNGNMKREFLTKQIQSENKLDENNNNNNY